MLDIVREASGVAESARLMRRYGISTVVGALDEGDGCSLAHAACGAMVEGRASAPTDSIAAPAAVLDFATFVEEFLINPITRQPFVPLPNRRRPLLSTLSGSARTVS